MTVLLMTGLSQATVYFYFDAEDGAVSGTELPTPASAPNSIGFCGVPCGGSHPTGTYESAGGAVQGDKYFGWDIVTANQNNVRNDTKNRAIFPLSLTLGTKYYLAYYMKFERKNGLDIWSEGSLQSADKGVEINGNGIRWTNSRGQWNECNGRYNAFMVNQDHRYTVWVGNPTYHINPSLEAYGPNLNGYSCGTTMQLEYDKWYPMVFAVKVTYDTTGSVELWVNGIKYMEYLNIKTSASSSPEIEKIETGGTMAQPSYNAPPHYRKFDALLLTDNWQDIVDGGYLAGAAGADAPVTVKDFIKVPE